MQGALEEEWLAVQGFEGQYQISNHGNARSLMNNHGTHRVRPNVPGKCRKGYLYLMRCVDGVHSRDSLHRLVAKHFIPNPENLSTVNHIDNNKANNHVSNLEWMSIRDNLIHALKTGLRIPVGSGKGKKWGNSSEFYNVTYDISRDRWIASVKVDKKSYVKRFSVKTHGDQAENLAALAVNDFLDLLGIYDRPKNIIN